MKKTVRSGTPRPKPQQSNIFFSIFFFFATFFFCESKISSSLQPKQNWEYEASERHPKLKKEKCLLCFLIVSWTILTVFLEGQILLETTMLPYTPTYWFVQPTSTALAAIRSVRSLRIAFEGSHGVALLEKLVIISILSLQSARLHHRRCEALCKTENRRIGQTG